MDKVKKCISWRRGNTTIGKIALVDLAAGGWAVDILKTTASERHYRHDIDSAERDYDYYVALAHRGSLAFD